MCKHNFIFLFSFIVFISLPLSVTAQDQKTPSPTRSTTRKKVVRVPEITSTWAIGASYVQWSETMELARGTRSSSGFANYLGTAFVVAHSWQRNLWKFSLRGEAMTGRATSGAFDGSLGFTDGVDKPWLAVSLRPSLDYQLLPRFEVGLGALTLARSVDWEPQDKALRVKTTTALVSAPELIFRLFLLEKLALQQTYSILGSKNRAMWTWSFLWIF